ncbi:MAG: hypothetical protein Q4A58_07260 [Fusobacterium sp.]|uniref:hypothetical protein n=1 Tax=Fusobacterium sp. TaxID=68766 RepID=UPI0026DD8658|nr:hypothetical protein [Fusobacterium sp.]MDO4691074.1 hypothetical protein [Fusobacterium sp.]
MFKKRLFYFFTFIDFSYADNFHEIEKRWNKQINYFFKKDIERNIYIEKGYIMAKGRLILKKSNFS